MKEAILRVVTGIGDQKYNFESVATIQKEGDITIVNYLIEGDRAVLRFSRNIFTMERSGDVTLSASFKQGERTEFLSRYGENDAVIPVLTREYCIIEQQDSFNIYLTYDFLFGNTSDRFNLEIFLSFSEAL